MSEEWRKPSDVMRIRRKKKTISKTSAISTPPKAIKVNTVGNRQSPQRKRKNPFGCSPRKRSLLKEDEETKSPEVISDCVKSPERTDSTDGMLLDVLNRAGTLRSDVDNHQDIGVDISYIQKLSDNTQQHLNTNTSITQVKKYAVEKCYYPQDWSLRMKVRYMSTTPFSWTTPMKTQDEAEGMRRHLNNSLNLSVTQAFEKKAELHRCCLHWVHPNIPWLKLFPRIISDRKIGKTSAVLQDKEVQDALHAAWTESLTSVFHLLRAGSCPYFYLCCHQFTVAFYASGTRCTQMEAVVTPTSRGFRESMKTEGIDFLMPLKPQTEETGTDEVEDADDSAATWLHDLGLDKRQYRSLEPEKVKLQKESFRLIDSRPESTVHIVDHDIQALFNFLLSYRSCIANTGVQAGIPPTIISPTPYKGATLNALKVKQSILRPTANETAMYSLEIIGPILPTVSSQLNKLLSLTQKDYTASYSVHEPSSPCNVCLMEDTVTNEHPKSPSTQDFHLADTITDSQTCHSNLGKEAIRELKYSGTGFTWTQY